MKAPREGMSGPVLFEAGVRPAASESFDLAKQFVAELSPGTVEGSA